jgi:AcrR family transcriptional regulator
VPTGTTSNYFANRDDLLYQVTQRTRERLSPTETDLRTTVEAPPSRDLMTRLMRDLLGRMRSDRSSYLAMLELRLEGTRRPELQATLTKAFTENLQDAVRFHLDARLPGDETTMVLLYLAMSGLLIDEMTTPDVLDPFPLDRLVTDLVERAIGRGPTDRLDAST